MPLLTRIKIILVFILSTYVMFKQKLFKKLITMAKHSMDETNIPPTIIVKSLAPLNNKKSIILWICKGATYH